MNTKAQVTFVYDENAPRYAIVDQEGNERKLALSPQAFQVRATRDLEKINDFLLDADPKRIVFTDPIQTTSVGRLETGVESVISGNTRTAILFKLAEENIEEFKRLVAANASPERLQEFFDASWKFAPFEIAGLDPETEADDVKLLQHINSKNRVQASSQEDLALAAVNMMNIIRHQNPNFKEGQVKELAAQKLGRATTDSVSFYQALYNQLNTSDTDWNFFNLAFRKGLLSADTLLGIVRSFKKFRKAFPDAPKHKNAVYFYNAMIDLVNKKGGETKKITSDIADRVFELEIQELTPIEEDQETGSDDFDSDSQSEGSEGNNGSRLASEKKRIEELPEEELTVELPAKFQEIDSDVLERLKAFELPSLSAFTSTLTSLKEYQSELDVNSQRVLLGLLAEVEIRIEETKSKFNDLVLNSANQLERVIKRSEEKKKALIAKAEAEAKAAEEKAQKKAEAEAEKKSKAEAKAAAKAQAAQEKARLIAEEAEKAQKAEGDF